MDIKIDEGLSVEFMRKALEQAKEGRMHILNIMDQCIDTPNKELSQYAPRFETIKIPQDTIGAVIGQGGETIRTITRETGTEINIEEDGTVLIAATTKEASDAAKEYIYKLTKKPEVGEIYKNCLVKEIRNNLGAFVEFLPKTSGLLHISLIAHERVDDISKYIKVGDKIDVKLIEMKDGKYRLSRKALLPSVKTDKKINKHYFIIYCRTNYDKIWNRWLARHYSKRLYVCKFRSCSFSFSKLCKKESIKTNKSTFCRYRL